jgi:hypothetical protein
MGWNFSDGDPLQGLEATQVVAAVFTAMGLSPSVSAEPRTITQNDSVDRETDYIMLVDCSAGPIAITLPSVADLPKLRRFVFKKIDNTPNVATLTPHGNETIDGAASMLLETQWEIVNIINGGTELYRI